MALSYFVSFYYGQKQYENESKSNLVLLHLLSLVGIKKPKDKAAEASKDHWLTWLVFLHQEQAWQGI